MRLVLIIFLVFSSKVFCQQTAPNGYYVKLNKVYTEHQEETIFKGVNRPSLEWSSTGRFLSQTDIQSIANSCSNTIRIPLNQDFWLKNTNNYQITLDSVICWCMNENLNVILDLHWSQKNEKHTKAAQQHHADEISAIFWYQIAQKYKSNGKILFELYNEPHNITWEEIIYGGTNTNDTPNDTSDDWTMIGYQKLYDTVRAAGAHNLVLIGGNDWSYDLSYYEKNPIEGYNIVYASHCYPYSTKLSNNWYKWTILAKTHPVILSEFGPNELKDTQYVQELIDTASKANVHWTAWAWFPFQKNNMWADFDPQANMYDTTFYGQWVYKTLASKCTKTKTIISNKKTNHQGYLTHQYASQLIINNKRLPWKIYSSEGELVLSGNTEKIIINNLPPGTYTYSCGQKRIDFIRK